VSELSFAAIVRREEQLRGERSFGGSFIGWSSCAGVELSCRAFWVGMLEALADNMGKDGLLRGLIVMVVLVLVPDIAEIVLLLTAADEQPVVVVVAEAAGLGRVLEDRARF
jgi:hypothetical protein